MDIYILNVLIIRCECGNCSLETEESSKCIREHPGFNEICLNEWVLEHAALGLKTKGRRNYASVFQEGQKTRAE